MYLCIYKDADILLAPTEVIPYLCILKMWLGYFLKDEKLHCGISK